MKIKELDAYDIIVTSKKPEGSAEGIGASIDYDDPSQVRDLMSKHLAKIFIATHKRKIKNELDKFKSKCK